MNLAQLKTLLEMQPISRLCSDGFDSPHSYRGYYNEVAFEPAHDVSIGQMLDSVNLALADTFCGWKGGEYKYNLLTPVHIAFQGCVSDEEYKFPLNIVISIAGLEEYI